MRLREKFHIPSSMGAVSKKNYSSYENWVSLYKLKGKQGTIPKLQERYLSYSVPWMSPTLVTELYSRMVDNFVDNVVSATNLANNLVMVNMESIQRLTDSSRTWRVGVESTRTISKSLEEPQRK